MHTLDVLASTHESCNSPTWSTRPRRPDTRAAHSAETLSNTHGQARQQQQASHGRAPGRTYDMHAAVGSGCQGWSQGRTIDLHVSTGARTSQCTSHACRNTHATTLPRRTGSSPVTGTSARSALSPYSSHAKWTLRLQLPSSPHGLAARCWPPVATPGRVDVRFVV